MTIRRDALTARREAMGYTQESLAKKLGVEFSTVGRWERGALTPQPWRRPDLARALKVSLEQLDSLLDDSAVLDRGTVAERVQRNQQAWLRVRQAQGARGRELTELAAWLYPKSQRALGGHVLVGSGWLLDEPVDLDMVRLVWSDAPHPAPQVGGRWSTCCH